VLDENLTAIPIPSLDSFPSSQLAKICSTIMTLRKTLQESFVIKYDATLAERGENIALLPDKVLEKSSMPTLSLDDAILRGIIKLYEAPSKLGMLLKKDAIFFQDSLIKESANLLFERAHDLQWQDALSLRLPDPTVASSWLNLYNQVLSELNVTWSIYLSQQSKVDDVIFEWYNFDPKLRDAINEGLPWAKRSQ
jgi:hypothetical protein